jgi:hypothetical protein
MRFDQAFHDSQSEAQALRAGRPDAAPVNGAIERVEQML